LKPAPEIPVKIPRNRRFISAAVLDKKKAGNKPKFETGPCPVRHIGNIVIWEGNYTSDIFNIGNGLPILEKKSKYPPVFP
jgi:hypothetical protein